MRVLHIVGGAMTNGAFKGAEILHKALINSKINSKILNDDYFNKNTNNDQNIIFINDNFKNKILNKLFVYIEKILKFLFLHSPRETFTIGLLGFDITKLKEYKDADIIHIHWLNQGFISLKSLSKIDKPLIWTMRDMWAFTGGPHYLMDFENFERKKISNLLKKIKKNNYRKHFQFVSVSDWLKKKAKNSEVLQEFDIIKIDNNIELNKFEYISQEDAKKILEISTKKQIILYGAQNPQSKRKGWSLLVEALKKIDTSKYYLLIFGNFWSSEILKKTGIEFKSLGFIKDQKKLNAAYSSADLFIASSIEDAWPKTFAEAMYCGTPVVCFKDTSLAEIVDHKINGFIVDDFDSGLLKDGIEWLSREASEKRIDRNKVRIKASNFDGKIIVKKYIKLYNEVIEKISC
tara:strand:+ start:344 stop:1558 length:1215 start_codon:yes stop_codon:yes gene_type:complete